MCNSSSKAKEYVIAQLEEYPSLKKKIALLQFERTHAARISEREIIDGMSFAHPVGEYIQQAGRISDKTMRIAMQFRTECDRLNVESLSEILQELEHLEAKRDKLEFYVSQLEVTQAEVIRKYYFEEKTWKELQEEFQTSQRTLMRHRDMGVTALAKMFRFLEQVAEGPAQ